MWITLVILITGGGVFIAYIIINILFFNEQQILTQQEAQYQHCLITKPPQFPNASSTVIDRICELEKIGRAM